MTTISENARSADESIEVRREAEITLQREIAEGLTRRHLAIAEEARMRSAANFATLVQVAPVLAAKLRRD